VQIHITRTRNPSGERWQVEKTRARLLLNASRPPARPPAPLYASLSLSLSLSFRRTDAGTIRRQAQGQDKPLPVAIAGNTAQQRAKAVRACACACVRAPAGRPTKKCRVWKYGVYYEQVEGEGGVIGSLTVGPGAAART